MGFQTTPKGAVDSRLAGVSLVRAFSWLVCRDSAQRRASRSRSADADVAGGHAEVARRRAAKFAASGSLQTNHENALAPGAATRPPKPWRRRERSRGSQVVEPPEPWSGDSGGTFQSVADRE